MEDYKLPIDSVPGLVSVIIPTHNRGDLILETLESIINQSYKNIEIIVVDDHSTEDIEFIVRNLQIKDFSQIYFFKSLKKGACAARNLGMLKSRGEFIQFFDDDDIMNREHIKMKIDYLSEHNEYDFVCCNFTYFRDKFDNIVGRKEMDNIPHSIESHLLNSAFPAPAFLCRRKSLCQIGFWNESCLKFQDICYFHRLFLFGLKGYWLKDFLFNVRVHTNNISSNKSTVFLSSIIESLNGIRQEWMKWGKENKRKTVNLSISFIEWHILISSLKQRHFLWVIKNVISMLSFYPKDFSLCLNYGFYKLFYRLKGKDIKSIDFITRKMIKE